MKKPTKTIKHRKRRIKGIVEDLRSGRYLDKDSDTIERMFRECGRPIKFSEVFTTELDCVATNKCKSTTPQIRRNR